MVRGGGKEMQVHTGDEKTTKRWEADDRARGRLKKDGWGKTTKKGTVVVVSLMTTTTTRCLLNDNVGVGTAVCCLLNDNRRNGPVGFITATTGDRGR